MKKVIYLFIFLLIAEVLSAQPYTLDPSFNPYFDISLNFNQGGVISNILESPQNGRIFIVGGFDIRENGIPIHDNFTQVFRNGGYNLGFSATIGAGQSRNAIYQVNDSMLALTSNGLYLQLDTLGALLNNSFYNNYWKTASCKTGSFPYFFSDGSSLMANSRGGQPTSCRIYSYNDTFPHRYIVKLNPQGLYDSSFLVSTNAAPRGFLKYDSSRILIYGQAHRFTQYNGRTVNGLCRIYHDGTLDTTFNSPLLPTNLSNSFEIKQINADGSLFINGRFLLKNDTANKYRHIVKLKPNGNIDSSFNFYTNLSLAVAPGWAEVRAIEETPDGGYLAGGTFDTYNGYNKKNIVKLDAFGNVESQYFLGTGPDSSAASGNGWGYVINIEKSLLGGYYVVGDFNKWDNQRVQPIVRIHDLVTGIKNEESRVTNVELYPNPSNGIVNVSNAQNIQSIRIYNLQGQLVHNLVMLSTSASSAGFGVEANTNQFELPEQKGMYLIQVEDVDGNVVSKKIVRN